MSQVEQIAAQIAQLQGELKRIKDEERSGALTQVRNLVATHELSVDEIFSTKKAKASASARKPVPVKYRNNETGETWTGRGMTPKWLREKNLADFLVN